jgi:tetratricopeptide (TPR) repeat protein
VSEHPDRITILLYVENDATCDRASMAEHLAACDECEAVAVEFRHTLALLQHRDFMGYYGVPDGDREELRAALLRESDHVAEESSAADSFVADLLARPLGTWDSFLDRYPECRTSWVARRLFEEVEVELNRRPEYALDLVGVAERIASFLSDVECRSTLGDVWKHRSNALRHLGRYDEALDAAELAESFHGSLVTGDFDLAQARYTRAGTLFKMTRYAEALEVLAKATATLRDYGDSVPLAKTIMLDAAIRIEEGDVALAQERWRDVLPILERLGDAVEHARVLANLAECNLRLGAYDQAMADAQRSVARYRELHMEMESIRSEWTIGMVHLARGESDHGLGVLENAAAAFEMLSMSGDAGFIKLDICEELLRREEWTEAEVTARGLASLFIAAHVTTASTRALDFLRRSVENRQATAETVRYVREYVTADDPARRFDPPSVAVN